MLSGIQHFYFCKRQWSLIHIENSWLENQYTAEGQILHKKADMPFIKEKRKDIFISRSIPVISKKLKLASILDIVEFKKDKNGIEIKNKRGKWLPYIVEYKRGKEKEDNRDIVQLVAQVMALEEMFKIQINYSYLYYFSTNKRKKIEINIDMRKEVEEIVNKMHNAYSLNKTFPPEITSKCNNCSLYDICNPKMIKNNKNIEKYIYGEEI